MLFDFILFHSLALPSLPANDLNSLDSSLPNSSSQAPNIFQATSFSSFSCV